MRRIMIFVLIAALLAFSANAAVTSNSPSLGVIQGFDKDSATIILTNTDIDDSASCVFTLSDFYASGKENITRITNQTSPITLSDMSEGGKGFIDVRVGPVPEIQGAGIYKADFTYNCSYNATDYAQGTSQLSLTVTARTESIGLSPSSELVFAGRTNTSRTLTFDVTNNGNVNLTNIMVGSDVDSRYNPIFSSNTKDVLKPGEKFSVSLRISIPVGETPGKRTIGTLEVATDQESFTKTNYIMVNAEGLLAINDLDVTVKNPGESSRSSNNLVDGDTISRDVAPGATVDFKIELINNHENTGDRWDIEDIEVTIRIIGIDDEGDDDLEEDVSLSDLRPERKDSATITFEIPWEVEEDTYDVEIFVEGEDEQTGDQIEITWIIRMEVKKENTKLKLTKASLEIDTLKCFRSTTLDIQALNIGSRDEDDARLIAYSQELGISYTRNFELTSDVYDDDSKQSFSIPIDLTDTFKAGSYRIDIQLFSDVDDLEDSIQLALRIEDCQTTVDPTPPPAQEEEEEEDSIDVIYTPPAQGPAVAAPVTSVVTKSNDTLYVVLLVLGIIVCVLLAMWLLSQLFKK